jgi:hypothetical protein
MIAMGMIAAGAVMIVRIEIGAAEGALILPIDKSAIPDHLCAHDQARAP